MPQDGEVTALQLQYDVAPRQLLTAPDALLRVGSWSEQVVRLNPTISTAHHNEQPHVVQLLRPRCSQELRVDEVVLPRAAAAAKHPVREQTQT